MRDIHRSADRSAKIIPVQGIYRMSERVGGIVSLVAVKLEQISVNRVGAAFGHYIDHAAGVSAITGAVVARLHAELL